MEELTMNAFLAKTNKKLKEISKDTNLSISIISRLKNGNLKISKKTKEIFEKTYNIKLIETNEVELKNLEIKRRVEENQEEKNKNIELNRKIYDTNLIIKKYKEKEELIKMILDYDVQKLTSSKILKIKKILDSE